MTTAERKRMTDTGKLDDRDVMVAEHEVVCAVLYAPYAQEQSGGRQTAADSADLDYSSDRKEEEFDALRKLYAVREAARLRTLTANLMTEATTAVQIAEQGSSSPGAGNREWQALDRARGVAQGISQVTEMLDREVKERG